MARKEGLHGFFKGNGVNILRIAPFSGFEFFFYDFYKAKLFDSGDGKQMSWTAKLICGGMTGSTASTLTYPLDLIRTHLSIAVESEKPPSIMQTAK